MKFLSICNAAPLTKETVSINLFSGGILDFMKLFSMMNNQSRTFSPAFPWNKGVLESSLSYLVVPPCGGVSLACSNGGVKTTLSAFVRLPYSASVCKLDNLSRLSSASNLTVSNWLLHSSSSSESLNPFSVSLSIS